LRIHDEHTHLRTCTLTFGAL